MPKNKNYDSQTKIRELYDQEYAFISEDGRTFKITEFGSLGILAIGYQGLIAWRKQKAKPELSSKK